MDRMRAHLLATLLFTSVLYAQTTAPTYQSNPKYTAAMAEAATLLKSHQYGFALDALKKANKLAEGQSRSCLDQIYEIQFGAGQYKDSVATATQLQALPGTPRQKSTAEMHIGQSLLKQAGDKPKPAQMDAAHTFFQTAITDDPSKQHRPLERRLPARPHGQNGRSRQGVRHLRRPGAVR